MAIQTLPIQPSAMPLISPSALLTAYLSQSPPIRPSNRVPTQMRPIHLNTSSLTHCNGSALCKIGESTIVCGVRAEILPVSEIPHYRASDNARLQPHAKDHDEGAQGEEDGEDDGCEGYEAVTLNNLLVPNLELSTNVHPSFPMNVPPTVMAQSLSQRVLSLFHSSHLVRVSDLEIRHTAPDMNENGIDVDDEAYVPPEKDVRKAYWVLYIDCVCLSYGGEGNVFDATVCAAVAALDDVRLPSARWDEDAKRVVCDADFAKATRLNLKGLPCPLSFAVYTPDAQMESATKKAGTQGNDLVLLDTDAFENDVCEEKGNVVVDCSGGRCTVLRVEKAGGAGTTGGEGLKELIQHAEKRWHDWKKVLDGAAGG